MCFKSRAGFKIVRGLATVNAHFALGVGETVY